MTRDRIKAFYALPHVRRRVAEYLGAENGNPASCIYVAQPDFGWPRMKTIRPPEDMELLLQSNHDLARSLWDRQSLIAHLDIEYVNFDFPCEAYIHPERSFRIQNPVRLAAERMLSGQGIDALHLMTGRGHHYTWRIPYESMAFKQLQNLGRCNDMLRSRYRWPDLPIHKPVPETVGRAYAGLGLIMEYIALQVRADAVNTCRIPVHLTAVTVGTGERGREMVSIDISEYGDPLHLRVVRAPFTAYLKPGMPTPFHTDADNGVFLTVIPPQDASIDSVLTAMRDTQQASRLAHATNADIPAAAAGMCRLIAEYKTSRLQTFHNAFFSQRQHPPDIWSTTYDMLDMDMLPPCVAHILSFPNDLLMRPAQIELVVRVLMAQGWHPRHIAGLIRSKYERDHGWCDQWLVHDAATRADFYTRIFASAFTVGDDELVDFNCTSNSEKGLCMQPQNGCELRAMRTALLERRKHE